LAKTAGKHQARDMGGHRALPTDVDLTATDPAMSWLPQRHVTAESFRPEPWSVLESSFQATQSKHLAGAGLAATSGCAPRGATNSVWSRLKSLVKRLNDWTDAVRQKRRNWLAIDIIDHYR
jgi:hypothetical protein